MINSRAIEIKEKRLRAVRLVPNTEEIVMLEDIISISDTVVVMQSRLSNLVTAAGRLSLTINSQRTKITIFRKIGHTADCEKWSIWNEPLEIVNNYTNLGTHSQ